tara:strand:+ start:9580 stop:10641 length:1062 start_codon:yes stop_codon:yes gene_type:complete
MKTNILFFFVLASISFNTTQNINSTKKLANPNPINLEINDITLIKEAFHLQGKLGQLVWIKWKKQKTPFLYKKNGYDFLLFHKKPPKDFNIFKSTFENESVYWRKSKDTLNYRATYPINEIPTVVMSAPSIDENVCEWVLIANHEMFHVFQESQISIELKKEQEFNAKSKKIYNELNFPYEYYNEKILAIQKLEADKIYTSLVKNKIKEGEANILKRRFADLYLIQSSIIKDTLNIKFKSHMEWKEGVARYTEQELAILASNKDSYKPTSAFKKQFQNYTYSEIADRYKNQSVISPIRFVGEGVIGRVMFYYTGLGKAYLLDKINPTWKADYFDKSLDELLIGEEQFLMCKTY